MPAEVKTRPPDSLPPVPNFRGTEHDARTAAHKVTQQQQQHREALRLALGSILSPKRPPLPSSRSSSGTTTPSYPFTGSHTPAGTPPAYYPLAHGPNSSEYLHPHHPHLHYPHSHPPSRLGRSNSSSNSPSGSGQNTAPNSSQPSPLPPVPSNLPVLPEIEPLPPAQITNGVTPGGSSLPNTPLQPNSNNAGSGNPPIPGDHPLADSADHAAHTATPRSKFMQTLQSNSAWDALIHGSFS